MPAEEQSAQSIIAHMNKDHKLALEDFLYVYGKVPITEEISNVRMQEFALDHMTITFEHSAIEFDVEKYIPIDPPLKDFSEARSRLVPMAKEAAAKRGFSHIRINEISKPRTILEHLIIVLVLLPFVAYVHRGILEFLPLPQSVLDFIGKDVVLSYESAELGMDCFYHLWNKLREWFQYLGTQRRLSIAVIGLQNSGKTTFTNLLVGQEFETDTIPTLGINIRETRLPNHTQLRIYDLAGQTRFQKLWERCFQEADLLVYMLDLSDLTNWESAKAKLHDVIITTNIDHIPILVLGNKVDLLPKFQPDVQLEDTRNGTNSNSNSGAGTGVNISSTSATVFSNPSTAATTKKRRKSRSVEQSTRQQTWKYVSPLLHNYEFEDIPKYDLNTENQHVLSKIEILSKELGIDLKHGLLHLPHDAKVKLNRDIALFSISCKDKTLLDPVIEWILEL
ncbi:arl10_like protein [Kluyveromyces marxianus DMKU3-1042]|uniref:Arl10_like protein n=1 Tax=Kluyveromyces marxianus (strain DMKU3-1042 / BCC 29191 / NBRC 104275) TaxID=1003335 RepID=W0T907_KLUMD|nr:uncharacterized protein KLMA_30580 [Kluyveromyces marxianus DMKU3-1042]BAO39875.2 arl10_like protein [Kluyveromyces marxianus DMKU3-1042]